MALLTKVFAETDDTLINVSYNGVLTTVELFDRQTGLRARAHARHHVDDYYDQTVGYDLAFTRATQRLATKKIRKIIAATR